MKIQTNSLVIKAVCSNTKYHFENRKNKRSFGLALLPRNWQFQATQTGSDINNNNRKCTFLKRNEGILLATPASTEALVQLLT